MRLLERIEHFNRQVRHYRQQSANNSGKLPRSDAWTHWYCEEPYLIRNSDVELYKRWTEIFLNQFEIDEAGRISPKPGATNDYWLMQKFTHLMAEISSRGGLRSDLTEQGNEEYRKYFIDGPPVGISLFKSFNTLKGGLVKFSKTPFVEDMLKYGRFRISPASHFLDPSLLVSQQDAELIREFRLSTIKPWQNGFDTVELDGKYYPANEDISISIACDDYYLLCFCREIDRRLPTDFEADAALIVTDRKRFTRLFFDKIREKFNSSEQWHGDVKYYDPYLDYKRHKIVERMKNYRYYYQKEYRYVVRPKNYPDAPLEPFFIEIGPMHDFAEAVYVPSP